MKIAINSLKVIIILNYKISKSLKCLRFYIRFPVIYSQKIHHFENNAYVPVMSIQHYTLFKVLLVFI